MSEYNERVFVEKISPFLTEKLNLLEKEAGRNDPRYLALSRQYVRSPEEDSAGPEANRRHYEADLVAKDASITTSVERLYRRTIVIELTMSCAAHCRYCLRQKYQLHTLTEQEIRAIVQYCSRPELSRDVNEVLVTGGDPLLIPQKLNFLIESLMRYAPHIKTIRVATRLPQQDPSRISDAVLDVFRNKPAVKFEIATQINHAVELFPEVRDCFRQIMEVVPKVYSQNVLLRGVNDTAEALFELYDTMRSLGIEPYYLFHAIPMRGMHHFRTSLQKGIELIKRITSCGMCSGRSKPMFSVMTDIGKITLYEGVILERDKEQNKVLLQSYYKMEDRLAWNPSWALPASARVDKEGYLQVWYLDGVDA